MENKYLRLNLSSDEFEELKSNLNFKKLSNSLKEKLENPIEIDTEKKAKSTFVATASRTKKAKEKIQNAINILRMENKTITHYSISQCSGVSFNTIKKYFSDETLLSLNEMK